MRNLAVVVLVLLAGFSLWRLGDVERQRYALSLGMCPQDEIGLYNFKCMDEIEPRTSRLWDVFYGLFP
jgi:hypothetical protein